MMIWGILKCNRTVQRRVFVLVNSRTTLENAFGMGEGQLKMGEVGAIPCQ